MGWIFHNILIYQVNVVKLPDAVSFEDASAISMVGMTAWHMLVDRAKINLVKQFS